MARDTLLAKTSVWSVLFICFLIMAKSQAAASPWVQTNGPSGGVINTIEIDPESPHVLYAGGAGGGVFKTTDGGASWTMLEKIVEPSVIISDILISSENHQTVYAKTDLLYKSFDGGVNWHSMDIFGGVTCVSMSRDDPSILIAGTADGKVYSSASGGESWKDITGNLPGDRIADIAIGATDEFWVGTANGSNGRLYRTTDAGNTWNEINIGKSGETDINTIFVDPGNTNIIYVGLIDVHNEVFDSQKDDYLFKTTNGGATWTSLKLPFTDAMINVIGRAPNDDTLYVGTGGTVYKSNDGGHNWTNISPPGRNGDMYDLAVDPLNTNVLYLPRRAYGIVKSSDGGANWTPINRGLLNVSISLLALPTVPGNSTVYATAVSGEGTFKTTDHGNSWTNVPDGGLSHPWADELVVSPHEPETVWEVADVGEVFKTTDGGTTWNKIINPYSDGFRFGSVHALAPAPSDSDIIYALKSGFGIFKTTDGGTNWQFLRQSEIDYTYAIAVHPTNPNIAYSGYNPKPFQDWAMVRQTTDGGSTWRTALSVPYSKGVTSVVIDPNNPDIIYAGSTGKRGQIYKSTNGGTSWSELNEHFIMSTVWGQPQLIIDPDNPSTAYAGTWLAGTWKTTDAGSTWTLLKNAPVSATSLSLNTSDTDIIYLSDRTAPKVWKTTDAGSTWEEIANFSSDGTFLVNRVLADGNTVYVATFGPSIHGGKLYKSTNSGSTWSDITGTLPRSVLDMAIDPTSRDIIYVTTHIYGAYKSVNGGTSWTEMGNFPDIGAYDIEVDPVEPTTLYACGLGGSVPGWCLKPDGYVFTDDPGVYKSTNSGSTWRKILTTGNECRAIRLHPDNHNMLFAAAMDDGLQVSVNGGSTWSSYNTGLATQILTSCAVAGNKIYVGSQAYGVHSGDINTGNGVVTWQQDRSNKPVPEVYNLEIKVDPTNSNRIFVGSNPGGLYRSDDGGATFYDKNFLTPSVVVDDPVRQGYYTFAINPSNSSEVWLGTWGKGIYKSYDGMDFDINAHGSDMKMYGKHIYRIIVDPNPPNPVYAATEEGVFRSSDGGTTWSDFSTGLDTTQIRTLAITADGTLLCGTLGYELYYYDSLDKMWRQMNGFGNFGTFWPIWNDRPLYQYTSLLFHPTDPDVIYFGTFPAGIYKSSDGGQTWRESNVGWTNDGVFCLVFHPDNPDIIYAGTYNGMNRSKDGSAHWEMWNQGWPDEQWVFSIDFDPRDPNVMYACSKNGENEGTGREGFHGTVMKSIDGGAHWSTITTGLNVNQEFYKIIVDKYDPDTLYLATQYEGVFISRDCGDHWSAWNEGLTNLVAGTNGNNVTNTMVMSADGLYLYFGSAGSGVFRRPTVTHSLTTIYVNKIDGTCGGRSPCYTSIQDAINAASSGSAIRITQGTYIESIVLNESKSLTLQGGWDSSFTTQTSNTTFIKSPKAPQGSLTLQMVTIRP